MRSVEEMEVCDQCGGPITDPRRRCFCSEHCFFVFHGKRASEAAKQIERTARRLAELFRKDGK